MYDALEIHQKRAQLIFEVRFIFDIGLMLRVSWKTRLTQVFLVRGYFPRNTVAISILIFSNNLFKLYL